MRQHGQTGEGRVDELFAMPIGAPEKSEDEKTGPKERHRRHSLLRLNARRLLRSTSFGLGLENGISHKARLIASYPSVHVGKHSIHGERMMPNVIHAG